MLLGDISESEGVADFVGSQLFEYVFLFGIQSLLNSVLALIWPLFVLESLGAWGLGLLLVAYLAFERLLRPLVEAHFPELRKEQD